MLRTAWTATLSHKPFIYKCSMLPLIGSFNFFLPKIQLYLENDLRILVFYISPEFKRYDFVRLHNKCVWPMRMYTMQHFLSFLFLSRLECVQYANTFATAAVRRMWSACEKSINKQRYKCHSTQRIIKSLFIACKYSKSSHNKQNCSKVHNKHTTSDFVK